MNRARQDTITTEIMEIVGGAEALGSGKKHSDRFVDRDLDPSATASISPFSADTTHHLRSTPMTLTQTRTEPRS